MTVRPVDAVLFDCDGTLADSASMIAANIVDALRDIGHTVHAEQVRSVFGPPLPEMVRLLVGPVSEQQIERFNAAYGTYAAIRRPLIQPMPGAVALLDSLAARRIPLAMVTNKGDAGAAAQIAAFGWEGRFAAVVTQDTVALPKPAPDPALHALRLLGVAPERAAFVGDTESGAVCGRGAGIPLVISLRGAHDPMRLRAAGATHVVETLGEVLTLLLGAGVSS